MKPTDNVHVDDLLMISQLQGELNVYIRADITGLDELFAISVVAIHIKIQIFYNAKSIYKLLIY